MAASYSSGYGTYNPRALEPYPIESTLAQLGYGAYGNSPAEAQTLMDQYWYERQGNEQQYQKELDAQHAQFVANLQQQMYEQNIKGLTELSKSPGGLQLAAASPYYQGILGGADEGTVQAVIGQQLTAQRAKDLEASGKGFNEFAQGGLQSPTIPAEMGVGGTMTDPAMVRAAQIRAGAQVLAARLRAQGENFPRESTTFFDPDTGLQTNVSRPKNMPLADWQTYLKSRGVTSIDRQPPPPQLPPAARDTDSSSTNAQPTRTTPAPPQSRTITNVPNAPTGNVGSTANVQQGARDAQQRVVANLDKIQGTKAYADIKAGMAANNGVPKVTQDSSGRWRVIGASGQTY